ncbi:NUDIX hydrolase [Sporosarcina sp. OR05]|uniref:NUDIX hydrolase n=1 Tax=Sporosarcina sp. OR05 TaxID=2969819 RepID=UPI00352A2EC4
MGYVSKLRELIGTHPIIMVGANVLVVDEENRLLLQLRADNKCWGLPGGSMDLGESLEEVARRELFEETNLVANELTLFNIFSGEKFYYKYPHGDEVYNVVATFVCKDYEGEVKKDELEVLDLRFFPIENLPTKISPPDFPIINQYAASQGGMKGEDYSIR